MKCVAIVLVFFVMSIHAKQSLQEAFSHIYEFQLWGANEEGQGCSGSGSTVQTTQEYRELLELCLHVFDIKSVVDLGCGDWEFSRMIPWAQIDYKGFDVVSSVIERNIKKYAREGISFAVLDATNQQLPAADLLICKDVLQHLSNDDVTHIIKQFSKFKYCLITNDVYGHSLSSDNPDIVSGDYRPIDITMPPFNVLGNKLLVYRSGYVIKQVVLIENI